jgi:ubiquinone/menaquinone biosynthesis C-methylase UbiE
MTTLMERLSGRSGGRILDAAAGGGRFIDKFNGPFRDIEEIIGIDITDEGFDDARERFAGDAVRVVIMDTANLEYPNESFDTAAMGAGMHHLDDVQAVLLQMMRVLKPGGTIVLREMYRDERNEKQKIDVLQHDWYAKFENLLWQTHHPTMTRQEIIDYMETLGLKRYVF